VMKHLVLLEIIGGAALVLVSVALIWTGAENGLSLTNTMVGVGLIGMGVSQRKAAKGE